MSRRSFYLVCTTYHRMSQHLFYLSHSFVLIENMLDASDGIIASLLWYFHSAARIAHCSMRFSAWKNCQHRRNQGSWILPLIIIILWRNPQVEIYCGNIWMNAEQDWRSLVTQLGNMKHSTFNWWIWLKYTLCLCMRHILMLQWCQDSTVWLAIFF